VSDLLLDLSLLDRRLLTSIKVGNLLVPVEKASNLISFSAKALLHSNFGQRNELSFCGSSTLLRQDDRYWALASRHQCRGFSVENMVLSTGNPGEYTTSNRVTWLGSSVNLSQSDEFDLVAFDFSEPVSAGVLDPSHFVSGLNSNFLQTGDKVMAMIVHGFRDEDQKISWDEDDELGPRISHFHSAKREIYCKYHGDSFEDSMARLTPYDENLFEMNGLSGAPVYALVSSGLDFAFKFAGMVLRGGGGNIHLLKHTVIRRLLEVSINGRARLKN